MATEDLTTGSGTSTYQSKVIETKVDESSKKTLKDLQKALKDINKTITSINTNLKQTPTHLNKLSAEMSQLEKADLRTLKTLSKGNYSSQVNRAALQKYSNELLYNNPAYIQSQVNVAGAKISKAQRANYVSSLSGQLIGSALGTRTGTLNKKIFGDLNESTLKDYQKSIKQAEENLTSMFYAGELGAKKFNTAMQNLSGASKQYLSPIEQGIKNSASATSLASREMERWQRISDGSLALIQTRLIANYAVINSVAGAFKYLLGYVVEFDKELRNLQAITGVSNKGLESLKESIISTANATRYTSLEIAKATTILGQAGLSVEQIKETIQPIAELATATGTDLTTATEVITSTLNVYELQASEAARVTNALTTAVNESKADISGLQYAIQYAGKSAADLGISFEETAAAVAAMTQAGVKSKSMLGTGLRAVMVELLNPTKKMRKEIESVGLTMEQVDVQSLGLTQVLKNLKDAGFGVAEAYRGMERRGASAMTALMSQVDFIDEVRERMNGSSAAIKGNVSQMQAFANVVDNTKSILGSAASNALTPFLRILTNIFQSLNDGMKEAPKWASSLTTGTALLLGLSAAAKAFYGILSNLFKLLAGTKGTSLLAGIFGAGGIKGVIMLTAAIGALGLAFDKLIDYINREENHLDELQAKMEDVRGEVSKYEESYNSLSNMMDRALQNRAKLFDEKGNPTQELDIFINELISRFPEVNDILSKNINSFEDLVKVIAEARLEIIRLKAVADDVAPSLAARSAKTSAKIFGRSEAEGLSDLERKEGSFFSYTPSNEMLEKQFGDSLNTLISARVLDKSLREDILTRTGQAYSRGRTYSSRESEAGREFGMAIKEAIDERFEQGYSEQTELLRDIRYALSNPKLSEELKIFLKQEEERVKVAQEQVKNDLSVAVAEAINKNIGKVSSFESRIKSTSSEYKDLTGGNISLTSVSDFVDKSKSLITTAETINEELTKLPEEIFNTRDWSDFTKKGITPQTIRYEISNGMGKYYQTLITQNRELIDGLVKDSEEVITKTRKESERQNENKARTLVKNLSSVSYDLLDNQLSEIKRIYNNQREEAKLKAEVDYNKLAAGSELIKTTLKEIDDLYDEKIKAAEAEAQKMKESIEATALKRDRYFKAIQNANEAVSREYQQNLDKLESDLKYKEGLVQGLGDINQGATQTSEYIRNRINDERRVNLLDQYNYAQKTLSYYEGQLKQVKENTDFDNISLARKKAQENLDIALKSPEKYSKDEMDKLTKELNNATRTEERYLDVINDLKEKIISLKDTMENLRGQMDSETMFSKMSTAESAGFGVEMGVMNYLEGDNTSVLPNMNKAMAELTALTTNTGLQEMESQFASLFRTIQDGSTSAKDAFKNFTTGILQAMADVIYSEIAKNMMKLLLSMFTSGSSNPMGDAPAVSNKLFNVGGTKSSGSSTESTLISTGIRLDAAYFTGGTSEAGGFGQALSSLFMAKGGLVNGPVKNRDSVPAKLMPGEFVMSKQATDALGTDFLNNLNNGNAQVLGDINNSNGIGGEDNTSTNKSKESIVNVWVVTPDQLPKNEGPNDVIAQVTQNIRTNGSIKKLIKQVSSGAL